MTSNELLNRTANLEEARKLAIECGTNRILIDELMVTFTTTSNYRINQRISWVFAILSEKEPSLFLPYQETLVSLLEMPKIHEGLKRNILRLWVNTGVPESLAMRVFNRCVFFLEGTEPIAVTAHAMHVATAIAIKWPELAPELYYCIEHVLKKGGSSAGIRSRGTKSLKTLAKIMG